MKNFLKQIEPIIKSKIRKYRSYIRHADYDDLMQEGYLAALIAANRWKIDSDKAGLMAWTMIHVESKFKELSMKSIDMVSTEDLKIEISQEQVHAVWGNSLASDELDETQEKIINFLIRSIPKLEDFLEFALDEGLMNISVAKNLGLTKQRISQLRKEVSLIFNCRNEDDEESKL
jgi:DNA-directed RNA polymerase specialized sigma subunit